MVYTVIIGIVIVALAVAGVVFTFWQEGSPLPAPRRQRGDGAG